MLLLTHDKVKKFRIAWRSNITDYTGNGEYCLTEQQALAHLDDLRKNCPELTHWMEEY
jgi:hypothetical protein